MSGIRDRSGLYRFGPFTLIVRERILLRDESAVAITPKAFETLVVLVENKGCVVEKSVLLDSVWPDTFVEEKTLAQNILTLRKILGADDSGQKYIETVPKIGYRFIAPVCTQDVPPSTNRAHGNASGLNGTPALDYSESHKRKRFPKLAPVAVTILTIAVLILTGRLWLGMTKGNSKADSRFRSIKLTNLTGAGRTTCSAISPDGKYLAYVVVDDSGSSVWVKQIKEYNPVRLLSPTDTRITAVTFSPDSKNVLFNELDSKKGIGIVNQVSVLGGSTKLLIEDVDSPISFSPDGSKVTFIRGYPAAREWTLMIRDLETGNERKVTALKEPEFFSFGGPSWSPDGKLIACARGVYSVRMKASTIQIETGKITDLPDQPWGEIEQVSWLHSGDGLIVTARAASQDASKQLWYLPYPKGQPQKVTQDLSNYSGISLSADSKTLVSVQSYLILSIREALSSDLSQEKQILPFTGGNLGQVTGISVSPNGNLVFAGNLSDQRAVWTVNADGTGLKQITDDNYNDSNPTVSRDGKSIAYISDRGGPRQIWIMDIDGKNQRQLTTGGPKGMPRWSPDGKWIVYTSFDKEPSIWKIPAAGGEPSLLTRAVAVHPDVSPDGKFIACYYWDERDSKSKVAVIPFAGGEPLKLFDVAPGELEVVVRWSPDGTSLIYLTVTSENPKACRLPLDGSPPECLNKHTPGFIIDLDWSRDTRQLFYIHGIATSDAIMIKDLPDSLKTQ